MFFTFFIFIIFCLLWRRRLNKIIIDDCHWPAYLFLLWVGYIGIIPVGHILFIKRWFRVIHSFGWLEKTEPKTSIILFISFPFILSSSEDCSLLTFSHCRVPSAASYIIYGKLCNLPVSFLSDTKSMLRTYLHRYWSLKIFQIAQYSKNSSSFSYFPILASWPRKRRLIITTIDNLISQSRQSSNTSFQIVIYSHFCYRFWCKCMQSEYTLFSFARLISENARLFDLCQKIEGFLG